MRVIQLIAVRVWSGPTSLLGLVVVALTLLTGGTVHVHSGVLEAHGGFARFMLEKLTLLPGGATAMALGHVVVGRTREALELTRRHERVHVRQCERWGPFFLPAYLCSSIVVALRGGNAYRDNPFEREAFSECEKRLSD